MGRVALLGIDVVGSRMAARFLDAGWDATVWKDRSDIILQMERPAGLKPEEAGA
jgi:3-hydroxyisobutyrate dehydrogenase-like beta-hydroxyacid dehydrogenase